MALKVICLITVENTEYEGGVAPGVAFVSTGWSGGAPGNFASSGRETIEILIDSAVTSAVEDTKTKLDVLKGATPVTNKRKGTNQ